MKDTLEKLCKKNFIQEESSDVIAKLGGVSRQYSEALHYYSPAAHYYVRRISNTCLPHTRTLSRWFQSIDGEPGFTSESFEALRLKRRLTKL
ncbi:hypothetical protein JTB14_029141 [Gonioctena quinquepunctata]|nr:hypothetical protein JTB14_029141 [Gonioctena quinquepunctata]